MNYKVLGYFICFALISFFVASQARAAMITNQFDFNNTSDLIDNFNSDTTPFLDTISSGGIVDSGAVGVPIDNFDGDIWTTKQSYDQIGIGKSATISAFFRNSSNAGYGGLGFSNLATNTIDVQGSSNNGIGVVFHGSGGYFINNGVQTEANWGTNLSTSNAWYKMIFEVIARGNNTYDLKFQIWNANANGDLISLYTEQSMTDVVNTNVGNASKIYGYFSTLSTMSTGRFDVIDNYIITIETQDSESTSTTSYNNPDSVNSAPSCNDVKPVSTPDLFQIDTKNNSAKLFFTPINNTSQFYVSFSENKNAERYGEQVTLLREGVQSHSIYFLKPNTTYYAKVRGQNGCMTGDWSNVMMFKTNSMVFFK